MIMKVAPFPQFIISTNVKMNECTKEKKRKIVIYEIFILNFADVWRLTLFPFDEQATIILIFNSF